MAGSVRDYLRELAWRYYRAMLWPNLSGSGVPESTRLVLFQAVGGNNRGWGLALILAAWRLSGGDSSGAELVKSYVRNTGVLPLVDQISGLKSAFPAGFQSFLEVAQSSGEEPKLAAAATYFSSVVSELSSFTRPALHSWLTSDPFSAAELKLVALVGGPPEPAGAPQAQTEVRRAQYDRKDYKARQPSPGSFPIEQSSPLAVPMRRVSTKVDKPTFATAYLMSLGWTQSDVARILVGPGQSHITAEALFRQVSSHSSEEQAQLVETFRAAGSDKFELDPSLVHGVEPAHLEPENGVQGVDQLVAQFSKLPPAQQKRFILLLQNLNPTNTETGSQKNPDIGTLNKDKAGQTKVAPSGDNTVRDVVTVVKGTVDVLGNALKNLFGSDPSKGKQTNKGKGGSNTANKGADKDDSDTGKADNGDANTEEPTPSDDGGADDTSSEDTIPADDDSGADTSTEGTDPEMDGTDPFAPETDDGPADAPEPGTGMPDAGGGFEGGSSESEPD